MRHDRSAAELFGASAVGFIASDAGNEQVPTPAETKPLDGWRSCCSSPPLHVWEGVVWNMPILLWAYAYIPLRKIAASYREETASSIEGILLVGIPY